MSKKNMALVAFVVFGISTLFFWQGFVKGIIPSFKLEEEKFGELCVAQAYPVIAQNKSSENQDSDDLQEPTRKERETVRTTSKEPKVTETKNSGKPLVIIYHTHGSESYQPYSKSNFHTTKEEGSVREVGNVMAKELEKMGIGVVHDKTIHDRESFNQSYDKSLKTVTALQKKYPTAKYIIDLHRDAAAYSGNVGKTMKINGETVAKYDLVVGKNNANYSQLMAYAKKVNSKANSLYGGFGGRIIEKTYRYNEYIANNYILLEIGNNQNDIKEVKATAKYFARVMKEVVKD